MACNGLYCRACVTTRETGPIPVETELGSRELSIGAFVAVFQGSTPTGIAIAKTRKRFGLLPFGIGRSPLRIR